MNVEYLKRTLTRCPYCKSRMDIDWENAGFYSCCPTKIPNRNMFDININSFDDYHSFIAVNLDQYSIYYNFLRGDLYTRIYIRLGYDNELIYTSNTFIEIDFSSLEKAMNKINMLKIFT